MSKSALALFIRTITADASTLRTMAADAFSADALHLVTANNGQPLADAMASLPANAKGDKIKGSKNLELAGCIDAGVAAMVAALPNNSGWVGAARGSFARASKEDRAPYLSAHADGVAAFVSALNASEAWADKVQKTKEEKAAEKAEKDAAKAEALAKEVESAINARIENGEIVRAEYVHTLNDFSADALIIELSSRTLTNDQRAMLADMLAPAKKAA